MNDKLTLVYGMGNAAKPEGFPLDAISADYRTGRHSYDGEQELEEDGSGYIRFLRKRWRPMRKRTLRQKGNERNDGTFVL